METEPTEIGPLVAVQLGVPTLPVNAKDITPAGAIAFAAPVTVAVNMTEPLSKVKVLGEALSTIVGVATEIAVVVDEMMAPTGL